MDTNTDMNTDENIEPQMTNKRPTVVTVAAILILVLTVFVAGLGIANHYGLLGRGFSNRAFVAGQFRSRNFAPPNGSTSNGQSNGFTGGQTGQGTNGFTGGFTGGGTNPTFVPNRAGASSLGRLLRGLNTVTLVLDIVLFGLAIVAAVGLFKIKRWAAILSIVLAVLVILLTIPGMLRIFSSIVLIEDLLRIGLGVAVIVLLLLPSARKAYLPAPENDIDL